MRAEPIGRASLRQLGNPAAEPAGMLVSRTPLSRAVRNRHHPLAAPTFENRLRMRSNRPSQTSR